MNITLTENTATNAGSHLLYLASSERWIEATACKVDIGDGPEEAWEFKTGRDAADWLLDKGGFE